MSFDATPSPIGDELSIHSFALDDDRDIELAKAVSSLSRVETARMTRFVHRSDRERYARGRGGVRAILAAALDCRPDEVPIKIAPFGKPVVCSAMLDFNLSHAGGHAVLAICRNGNVGIDLELGNESLAPDTDILDLARSCMSREETTVLMRTPCHDRRYRFLLFWTAKEARMKLHGQGLSIDPRRIDLALSDGEPTGFRGPMSQNIALARVQLPVPGAICHVARDFVEV